MVQLTNRLQTLENTVNELTSSNTFAARVDRYSRGGLLTTTAVCKIMNWSGRTLRRRLESNTIPMVKDGGRWIIGVEEFIEWHKTTLNL